MFSGPARWLPKTARSACWSSPRSDRLADVGGSGRAAIVLSHLHLGVAILLAAVCGGLITVLVGIARMFRLRRAAKKNLKALTSRR
jgi:hypothetical protein